LDIALIITDLTHGIILPITDIIIHTITVIITHTMEVITTDIIMDIGMVITTVDMGIIVHMKVNIMGEQNVFMVRGIAWDQMFQMAH